MKKKMILLKDAEIFKALVDGMKLGHTDWAEGDYIHLVDGYLFNEAKICETSMVENDGDGNYFIVEEGKPKRKFYRRKWLLHNERLLNSCKWHAGKVEFDNDYSYAQEMSDEWEEIEI